MSKSTFSFRLATATVLIAAATAATAAPWTTIGSAGVVDDADAGLAGAVEDAGMRCIVAPTVMRGPTEAAALARVLLDAPRRRAARP
jgi:hypothetical protein